MYCAERTMDRNCRPLVRGAGPYKRRESRRVSDVLGSPIVNNRVLVINPGLQCPHAQFDFRVIGSDDANAVGGGRRSPRRHEGKASAFYPFGRGSAIQCLKILVTINKLSGHTRFLREEAAILA